MWTDGALAHASGRGRLIHYNLRSAEGVRNEWASRARGPPMGGHQPHGDRNSPVSRDGGVHSITCPDSPTVSRDSPSVLPMCRQQRGGVGIDCLQSCVGSGYSLKSEDDLSWKHGHCPDPAALVPSRPCTRVRARCRRGARCHDDFAEGVSAPNFEPGTKFLSSAIAPILRGRVCACPT